MAKASYIGVGSKARKIKKWYLGVNGVAHKVKKAYVGIGGKARLFFTSDIPAGLYFVNFSLGGGTYYTGQVNPDTLAITKQNVISITYRYRSTHNTAGTKNGRMFSLNNDVLWEIDPTSGSLLRNTGISDTATSSTAYRAAFAGIDNNICRGAVGRDNMHPQLEGDKIEIIDPDTGVVKSNKGTLYTNRTTPVAGEGTAGHVCVQAYWTNSEGDGSYAMYHMDIETKALTNRFTRYITIESRSCVYYDGKFYVSNGFSGQNGYTRIFDSTGALVKTIQHTLNTPGDIMYWTTVG